mmetsp:Transcript_3832/g.9790  ORF Transcript_3832/g.9790 Transcript_3832/m.9790 type:complete len:104 (-) Transcript_3832:367-678(-)
MLGGLVFLKTAERTSPVDFFTHRLGMSVWLEQPNITILKHGNMILGFHQSKAVFVYSSTRQVDDMYDKLKVIADGTPRHNERYQNYQFFANDPEGRNLEYITS